MRLFGYYDRAGLPAIGLRLGDRVLTLPELDEDLSSLLVMDPDLTELATPARDLLAGGVPMVPVTQLDPAPAVPRPGKIVCIGLNYRDHVAEQRGEIPSRPLLFAKFANTVIADGAPIIRPAGTQALDLEAELGVVIGRDARRVRRKDAMRHVAGYVACNDVTARDWQGNKAALKEGERGDGQWLRAKGSDTFLPMGPDFVTPDEVPDPHRLAIRSWRIPGSEPDEGREVLMQDGTTADMIFDIPSLIEFVSAVITLEPGDIISTGTPAGVGVFRDPPVFLQPGDRVRVEVEGIGSVGNPIMDVAQAPQEV